MGRKQHRDYRAWKCSICLVMLTFISSSTNAETPNLLGYLPILALPPNYPIGYVPHKRVFTGEIFTKDSDADLDSGELVFFPKDYLGILESSFVQTVRSHSISVKSYQTIAQARVNHCPLIIWVIPLSFLVEDETKAFIKILYRAIWLDPNRPFKEWTVETSYTDPQMPRSITSDTLVYMIGHHEFNFQPQRALLTIASVKNIESFLHQLSNATAEMSR